MTMKVLVEVFHGKDMVDVELVEALAKFAMENLGLADSTEVSVTFVDNGQMGDLNFQYRGIEGPTDVLSFECDNLEDDFPDLAAVGASDDVYSLGDVIIAPDVALTQAEEFGNTFDEEVSLLLVHGILHLDGYDHIDDAEAEVMEKKQSEILSLWRERGSGV